MHDLCVLLGGEASREVVRGRHGLGEVVLDVDTRVDSGRHVDEKCNRLVLGRKTGKCLRLCLKGIVSVE